MLKLQVRDQLMMRNKIRQILWLLCCLPVLTGCIGEDDYANDPKGNFEQLWKIIDEQYCFLDTKGIDWDAVHDEYSKLIIPSMSNDDLFDILSQMLYILKDGHVNLSSASRISYYDAWYQGYPWNYREDILYNYYLGSANSGYRTSAGLKYKIFDNNIGYIRYESFSAGVGDGNLDEVLYYLQICNGLIIDVRDNGGGNLTNSSRIAARFTDKLALTGYIQHKTGPGHNDFSEMEYEEESQQDGYDGESIRVNTDWLYDYEEQERKRQERMQPEESSAGQDYKDESGKIVPMKKRETTGITLMKLDANHRVMARYRVNKIPFTIGRSTSNDLVLDDLCVARNHCRIIERDGRYLLEDVGTMNKLYVNGMVTGQVPLSDGLRVYIGNEEFQIAVEGGRSQSTRLYKNAEGSYE